MYGEKTGTSPVVYGRELSLEEGNQIDLRGSGSH